MRTSSLECQATLRQSVASSSVRPPGRSTRAISARARSISSTYSSTWVDVARSNDAASAGRETAFPELEHRLALVDAEHVAAVAYARCEVGAQEARSAAHVERVVADARSCEPECGGAPQHHLRALVLELEAPRHVRVELQTAAHLALRGSRAQHRSIARV